MHLRRSRVDQHDERPRRREAGRSIRAHERFLKNKRLGISLPKQDRRTGLHYFKPPTLLSFVLPLSTLQTKE